MDAVRTPCVRAASPSHRGGGDGRAFVGCDVAPAALLSGSAAPNCRAAHPSPPGLRGGNGRLQNRRCPRQRRRSPWPAR